MAHPAKVFPYKPDTLLWVCLSTRSPHRFYRSCGCMPGRQEYQRCRGRQDRTGPSLDYKPFSRSQVKVKSYSAEHERRKFTFTFSLLVFLQLKAGWNAGSQCCVTFTSPKAVKNYLVGISPFLSVGASLPVNNNWEKYISCVFCSEDIKVRGGASPTQQCVSLKGACHTAWRLPHNVSKHVTGRVIGKLKPSSVLQIQTVFLYLVFPVFCLVLM